MLRKNNPRHCLHPMLPQRESRPWTLHRAVQVHLTGPIGPLCKESGDEQCEFDTTVPFQPKYLHMRVETY